MIKAAFFDTKSYDRKYFENAHGAEKLAMRLLVFPNVLITAHQAFLTDEALTEIARVTSENVARFAESRPFLDGTQL